jgi:1,4-dihydroxy-6-naphthoate synthase
MTRLSLAISPCPNDTFMFDALLNNKLRNLAAEFDIEFADIEQLNIGLQNSKWDIAKMSVAMFPQIRHEYVMLGAGMAMGFGNGPLIVSHHSGVQLAQFDANMLIPGINTTANLLLTRFFPHISSKTEMLFSDILSEVANKKAEAGLIIHESRFTYAKYGLHKIADLGEIWFSSTKMPLPLGCIVARRSLGEKMIAEIESQIRESIEYGFANREDAMGFVRSKAQENNDSITQQHIDLYVNNYSINMGKEGRDAVLMLLRSLPENHSLSLSDIFTSWEN